MPHDTTLLATLAAALLAAWVFGLVAQRLRFSPIVGYLIAGIVIGRYTPGYVADIDIASQLAEVGVILLMFGVGLHFHLQDLLEVRRIAIPGALVQSTIATLLGWGIGVVFGWPTMQGMVLGISLSVASTVVLLRGLEPLNLVSTPAGHVAIGWLIVEDILTVVVLVVIPALAGVGGGAGLGWAIATALAKLAALVAVVFLVGARVVPWILVEVARLQSRELFTLSVLAITVAIAGGSAIFFGASVALGAFLAGMVVGQTKVSQQAAADALPLRDAFAVLFFVSVGMLFEPGFVVREPWMLIAALGVVLVGKPLAALAVIALLGYSTRTALVVALGLAQIGEFSFILGSLARHHGVLSETGYNLIVATALVSISINPFLFLSLDRLEAFLRSRPAIWRALNRAASRRALEVNASVAETMKEKSKDPASLAIIVGFGPVGQAIDRGLRHAGMETIVIDQNMDTVRELSLQGRHAIYGDATNAEILKTAGIHRASQLIVTLPHSVNRSPLILSARQMNATCRVFVRARYLREKGELVQVGAHAAIFEEAEAAVALTEGVLRDNGIEEGTIRQELERVRAETTGGLSIALGTVGSEGVR